MANNNIEQQQMNLEDQVPAAEQGVRRPRPRFREMLAQTPSKKQRLTVTEITCLTDAEKTQIQVWISQTHKVNHKIRKVNLT